MNDLGFLERLLDGAAVEWVPLGDPQIGVFIRGGGLQKKDFVEQGVPCIHYGQIYTHFSTFTNRTKSFVSEDFAKKARKAKPGDLVIATTSENDEDVCKAVAWLGSADVVVSSDACFYTHNLNPKYVSYFFQTEHFQKQKKAFITGTKVRRVNADDLAKILIPIPCPEDPQKSLAIQGEIVRILDAFTALTAELTAELTARKTQYNHYRNQLLSFEGGEVEWKTLGEVASFTYGLAAKAQDFGEARFIRISDIDRDGQLIADLPKFVGLDKESKRYLLKKNDLLMARTGATFGKTMIFAEDYPAVFAGFLIKIDLESTINPKYYWHFAQSSFFWDQANALVSGGGQPQFNANALQRIEMPIPYPYDPEKSLAEQVRIVAILDKFDTLATSLASGLPREIALRKRQYEHYRNLLLGFPKGDAA